MEGEKSTIPATETPNPMNTSSIVNEIEVQTDKTLIEGEGSRGTKSKKSMVWDHFTKLPLVETKGEHKAKCNHCRSIYNCHPNKHGTKYWGSVDKFNPLLFVAVVLDPRYKLEYVTYCIEEMYDQDLATRMSTYVLGTLEDLYKFYSKGISNHKDGEDGDSSKDVIDENLMKTIGVKGVTQQRVQVWKKKKRAKTNSNKTDLDIYLEEDDIDFDDNVEFDILGWWKTNSSKYKILSMIARDVLAIPISTVASESCFSTSGRVLDVYRSSLSPKMTEALICAQSWLQPVGHKYDEEFDQYESNENIIYDVSLNTLGTQGGNDTQEVLKTD